LQLRGNVQRLSDRLQPIQLLKFSQVKTMPAKVISSGGIPKAKAVKKLFSRIRQTEV
jgi:hypothetical protein